MRTPSWDFAPATLAIQREMDLLYDSSLMADDDPSELNVVFQGMLAPPTA